MRYLLIGLLAMAGCGRVEREIVVNSRPEGASVTIDGQMVGTTPRTIPFLYYGTHEIVVEKPGFERVVKFERIKAPMYQWFPIDFVTEVLLPCHYRDVHTLYYELTPTKLPSREEVVKEAEKFREEARPKVGIDQK